MPQRSPVRAHQTRGHAWSFGGMAVVAATWCAMHITAGMRGQTVRELIQSR
jgi:hypothetical protein